MKSRLPNVGTTIFTVMSKMAVKNQAINLSQGFPDFKSDENLIRLVGEYMEKGFNQYAPMPGVPELRMAIAVKTKKFYGAEYNPETEVTVTSGATEALFAAITSVVTAGDEVIILDPAYDCYSPTVELSGATPVHISLNYPDFSIPWDKVKEKINPKTRLLIVNSPHNPTGAIISQEDIKELENLVTNNDLYILSDEVYEHIIFDGSTHLSMSRSEILKQKSFVVCSFGKTYHNTGWKIGYCVAPAEMSAEFRKIHQFLTFATNTPIQYALADYISTMDKSSELPKFYQQKRDYFLSCIEGSLFKPLDCKGTYFQSLDYSALNAPKEMSDLEFATLLTEEYKVASIPTSVFYKDGINRQYLRFCFAKSERTLKEAGEKLNRASTELKERFSN